MAQTTQIWADRFPSSGTSGLTDDAVGIVTSHSALYVTGTKSLSSTNSVITLRKLDFDGNVLAEVQWPPNPTTSALRIARGIAIRTSPSQLTSTIAVIAAVPGSPYMDAMTLAYFDDDGDGGPQLVGNPTFIPTNDLAGDRIPVAVDISPDGTYVGTLLYYEESGKSDYAMVIYSAGDMQIAFGGNKYLGGSSINEYPADIMFGGSGDFYVTGTSISSTGVASILTARFALSTSGTRIWEHSFSLSGTDCYGAAFARQYDGNFAQGQLKYPVLVGQVIEDDESDFLTVAYHPTVTEDAFKWYQRFDTGYNEEANSAAAFAVTEPTEDLDVGYYVYVTGTQTTSNGQGTNILTQLYHDPLDTNPPEQLWASGAIWNNELVDGNDRGGHAVITSTDDTNTGTGRSIRALVAGTTTDSNGNIRYVTLKYDSAESASPKTPKWVAIENNVATVFANVVRGIGHMTRTIGESRKLWFFNTGFSNAGASVEDIWTVGTREDYEP